jgi:hypothetical protein
MYSVGSCMVFRKKPLYHPLHRALCGKIVHDYTLYTVLSDIKRLLSTEVTSHGSPAGYVTAPSGIAGHGSNSPETWIVPGRNSSPSIQAAAWGFLRWFVRLIGPPSKPTGRPSRNSALSFASWTRRASPVSRPLSHVTEAATLRRWRGMPVSVNMD